jgi:hypothetical protein
MPRPIPFLIYFIVCTCASANISAATDSPPKAIQKFLENNCSGCHLGDDSEAGFDLAFIDNSSEEIHFENWTRIYDRVNSGEMPPPEESIIELEEREQFLIQAKGWITHEQNLIYDLRGRSQGKRLTRIQLENTLHDLLGIDVPLADMIPEEPLVQGFTTVGEGQPISHHQLQQHVSVIDRALEEAFERAKPNQNGTWKRSFRPQQIARANHSRRCREPEMREGLATTWSSNLVFYGRLPVTTADRAGWYKMTLRAKSIKPPSNGSVWCSIRTGECQSGAPLMTWVDSFEVPSELGEKTVLAWLPEGHMFEVRPADANLKKASFNGGQVGTGEGDPQNVPGIGIDSIVLEKIHPGKNQLQIREILFGSYQKKEADGETTTNESNLEHAKQLIHHFARRAFRRPTSAEVTAPYFAVVTQALKNGQSFEASIRLGYRAILCSPRFLLFPDPAGKLDAYSLASRLSYFLWNRMPDEELLQLANNGSLTQENVLHQQVERLLNHPSGQQFVSAFSAEWLDLRLISFTEPDPKLYPGFDSIVENSMLAETHAFLRHLIKNNRSVAEIIDSQYTFLNSRLASYYGIENVAGGTIRKVALDRRDHRGGLLTQGAVLKVTANGTQTSPVTRGVWISERILGIEIPPPPANIPAIEPDTRGTHTIREQLQKHKNDAACASCHAIIDPPGFALENYDPSGRWRDYYSSQNGRKRVQGLPINASSEMSDGQVFKGAATFKTILLSQKNLVAQSVAKMLLTYATGAPVTFADRDSIVACVEETSESDYGFRSLIHAVVDTPEFLNK